MDCGCDGLCGNYLLACLVGKGDKLRRKVTENCRNGSTKEMADSCRNGFTRQIFGQGAMPQMPKLRLQFWLLKNVFKCTLGCFVKFELKCSAYSYRWINVLKKIHWSAKKTNGNAGALCGIITLTNRNVVAIPFTTVETSFFGMKRRWTRINDCHGF